MEKNKDLATIVIRIMLLLTLLSLSVSFSLGVLVGALAF